MTLVGLLIDFTALKAPFQLLDVTIGHVVG
jgi:hypothetical protein